MIERDHLSPLTFQALVGSALAGGFYTDLFRADGFAKTQEELVRVPVVWQWFWDNAEMVERDRRFKAELARLKQ